MGKITRGFEQVEMHGSVERALDMAGPGREI